MRLAALALAAVLLFPAARARAGGDDLGLGDLGAAAAIPPKTRKALDAHLAKAKKLIARQDYAGAKAELKAADKLVPMNDEVMSLLDRVESMEAEQQQNKGLVKRLEAQQAAKDQKAAAATRTRRAVDAQVRRVERHRHLPRRLGRAIVALRRRRRRDAKAVDAAVTAREQCHAAAILAHDGRGASRCHQADARVAARQQSLRALDDDLAVLTTTYRDRRGQKALDALGGR